MSWLVLLALIAVATSLRADDATARFYEQLRQRQLFGLVESDCLRRLDAKSLGDRERGEFVLELSRTYAAHAWHTVGSEQADLWHRAARVIVEHLDRTKSPPRQELLETQLALIELGRADWSLAQLELRPEDRELREQGRTSIDAALLRLTPLEKTLAQQEGQSSADKLSPFERRALWMQLRFRLGLARLTKARLATDNADRLNELDEANTWLKPLATASSNDRLTGESQLALAEVSRLRNDLDLAAKLLAAFEKSIAEDTSLDLRERFVIERLRGMLAQRKPAEAAAWLIVQRQTGVLKLDAANPSATGMSGELAYWQIVIELALWRVASERGDTKLTSDLWDRVSAEVTQLQQTEAGYWAVRARLDWQRGREERDYGRELAGVVRQARSSFSSDQIDEAISRFDVAIAAARKRASDPAMKSLLLELTDTRASLLFQAKRFDEAAAAFRELAEAPRHERSAATHLLWAVCLGKQFEKTPTDKLRAEFLDTLQQLRERYSDQPVAAEAAWLLGQMRERQQDFLEAIELFASIPAMHTRFDEAWAAIARCHERHVSRLRAEKKPTAEAESAAIKQLQSAVEVLKSQISNSKFPISNPQAELLVRFARLLLERHPADYKTADQWLAAVLAQAKDRDWLRTAEQLRVVSLAGQRRIAEAEKLIGALDESGPDELLALLDGLSAVAARCDRGTQTLVAELQLRASQALAESPKKLTEAQRLRLWRTRAEAFAATGQPTKAVAVYQQLVEKSPRDSKLLRTAAELCESLSSTTGDQQAKTFWRRLETVLKAGSPEWLDARWHVIHCCQRLGESAEATKLLKVTKLLYPDLGGDSMRVRFEELDR
ncbi:MAG: tetratricopeptide repeat protein [Planctomycetaceae bacterium]